MEVIVSSYQRYKMDEKKILSEQSFNPPPENATLEEKKAYLRESFYELGCDRTQDHVDGTYVWLVSEDGEADFEWPKDL